tara:strand:- start:220 stop:792 length:573 start_codon:yes stop_codon:yes gene_type:complete
MLNIIGGRKKRLKLEVPIKGVRPTSSKKRESIFSILENIAFKKNENAYKNKYYIDLFAGSGSLGLEAISRGIKFCYFYEKDNNVASILEKNCLKVCDEKKFQIVKQDINNHFFQELKYQISVIFIDPPYKFCSFKEILDNLLKNKFVTKNTIFIIESAIHNVINYSPIIKIFDERKYGKTKITFLNKNSI